MRSQFNSDRGSLHPVDCVCEGVISVKRESSKQTRVSGQVAFEADLQEFGQEVLSLRRKALGLTQQQMASKIGISQSRLSRIEAGSYDEMAGSQFRLFVEAYRLTNNEKSRWQSYLFGTDLEVPALDGQVSGEDLIDLYTQQLAAINATRLEGNISLSEDLAASTSTHLLNILARPIRSPTWNNFREFTYTYVLKLPRHTPYTVCPIKS